MKLSSTRSFTAFCSVWWEPRTINLLSIRILGYNFPGYSSYTCPTYYGFKQNLVNSVNIGAFSGLRHVVALSNSINCNIQPFYPLISDTLVKRKHFQLSFRLHNSNGVIAIKWIHTANNPCRTDTSENRSIIFQTKKTNFVMKRLTKYHVTLLKIIGKGSLN